MKVLHISSTPLVGAPYFWSECMSKSGLLQSRCYSARWKYADMKQFPHDIEDPNEAKSLIGEVDMVLVHNRLPSGFAVPPEKLRFVVHSEPGMIDQHLFDSAPKTGVLAQYHGRMYTGKRKFTLLPNLIDLDYFKSKPARSGPVFIGFSPSNIREYPKKDPIRYMNTKEVAITSDVLHRVRGARTEIWHGLPWADLMKLRAACDIVIDEVATGGYHRTSLEAAACGQLPVNNADRKSLEALYQVSGAATHPFHITDLWHLHDALGALTSEPEVTRSLGALASAWMERHWNPTELIKANFLKFLE